MVSPAIDDQAPAAPAGARKSSAKRKLELTDQSVAALAPEDEVYVVWDTLERRFGVRVHPTGLCTYFMRFSMPGVGNNLGHTIGSHGVKLSCRDARVLYRRAHMKIRAGIDPRQSRQSWRAEAWMRPGKAS